MTAAPTALFTSADVQMLTDLAFVAAGRGALRDADALAGGLACLRPGRGTPSLVMALAHMNAGDHEAAVNLLGSCPIADEAERQVMQSFLGLALQLAGRASQSQRVLRAAASHSTGRLARAMLGLRDNMEISS